MPGSEGMMADQTFSRTSANWMAMRSGPCLVWLKDLFPRWMQSLLPSTVHDTKKHSSWFDLVRILIIPDAGELEGIISSQTQSCVQGNLCFFSKLFDVYSKPSSSWIFCSVPGVFVSFQLYLKASSDLDRVGSMVGKQDWLNEGDRVQFAEMTDERSLSEIRMNRIAKLSHFCSDVYSARRVKILDCNERLHVLTSCSYTKFLPAWCLKGLFNCAAAQEHRNQRPGDGALSWVALSRVTWKKQSRSQSLTRKQMQCWGVSNNTMQLCNALHT